MITPETSEPAENWQNMVLTKNKRDEFLIEIRKKKSDNLIKQKRHKLADIQDMDTKSGKGPNLFQKNNVGAFLEPDKPLSEERKDQLRIIKDRFFEAVQTRNWDDLSMIVHFLKEAVVSNTDRIPPKAVIDIGIVPDLLGLLHEDLTDQGKLQTQAAWLLANITAGTSEDTMFVVKCNSIPVFARSLSLKNDEVHENTMWALANIAGEDDLNFRDAVLEEGVLQDIVRNLCRPPKRTLYTRTAVWLLSILMRGPEYPPFEAVESSLVILAQLIHKEDQISLEHILKSLASLTESRDEATLTEIANYGFLPKIIKFINHEDNDIAGLALHIVGNFAYGNSEITRQLVENNILQMMPNIIDSRNKGFRHEGLYILSNILADKCRDQNKFILGRIMPIVIQRLEDDNEAIRSEATHCISSFLFNCAVDEAQLLASLGVIESLLPNLKALNMKLVSLTLGALYRIFSHGKQVVKSIGGENPYVMTIVQNNAGHLLEDLQTHKDGEIYKLVAAILDEFFTTETDFI